MTQRLRLISAALLALGLAGCGGLHHRHGGMGGMHGGHMANPLAPKVVVANGMVQVDQQVLYFPKGVANVPITWTLPADSPYTFAPNGIQFEPRAAEEIVRCQRNEKNPREFSCLNLHTRKGAYAYDINVTDGKVTLTKDPFLVNDW